LGKYVNLGTVPRGWSKKGLTVYVLKEVARADLVVLFSSVSPHLQAGFGGGFKLVLPGCAHSQTIGNLHKIGLNKQISRLVGQQPSQNRMRQTVERGGDLLGDKVYSVSAVLDSSGQVCELGFGDPGEVQKQLSLTCEQNSGLAVEHTADVAIVSAFPRNYDLLQGLKCLVNTRMAARKRGILIGMMNLRSPGHLKLKGSLPLPMVFFRLVFRLINARFASAVLGKLDKGLDAEAKFFIRLAVETIKRNRVLLYCPGMVEEVDQLPTVEIFDDLDSLWARAEELLGKPEQVRVNVFAEGGTSYPRRKLSHNI
jgi:hypothetical protein